MSRKILNAAEMGEKGGKKTRDSRPEGYYSEIGAKGNEAIRNKYKGTDFFMERSKKATAARLKKKAEREASEAKKNSPLSKFTNILTGKS